MLPSPSIPDRSALVAALQAEVHRLEGAKPADEAAPWSTGLPPLDALLPGGGLARGTLVEWLAPGSGSGAGMLALLAAREVSAECGVRNAEWKEQGNLKSQISNLPFSPLLTSHSPLTPHSALRTPHCETEQAWVVCDRSRQFYPPAAAAWGLDLSRLILLHPRSAADETWAIEQCLRCPGVAAVWSPLAKIDATTFRRWQLAAEEGGGLGLFLRPAKARGEPTWAQVQIAATPRAGPAKSGAGRRWRLEVVRCPAGKAGGVVEIELNQATGEIRTIGGTHHVAHSLPPVSKLARAARRA